jgi:glycosyl transferase family 25
MRDLTPQFPVPVYLINLDRSPDRLAHAAAELDRCGIPFTRVPAIDGKQLGDLPWPDFDDACYRRRHGKHPVPGEWGCYMSHVLAIKTFLASSDAPAALILEDDIVLPADFPALIEGILRHAPDWDMVKLVANRRGLIAGAIPISGSYRMGVSLRATACSGAYLLNRRAAARYAAKLLPMTLPYDHEFDQGWLYGLRVRIVDPLPVSQSATSFPSTIANTRKFPWYKRGNVLLYRACKELRRMAHGVREACTTPATSRPPA